MFYGTGGHVEDDGAQAGDDAHQSGQRQQPDLTADAAAAKMAISGSQPATRHNDDRRGKNSFMICGMECNTGGGITMKFA